MPDQADWLYTSLLVLRCQAGDAAAFEELVSRYQPGLRFFLRKMLGETHGADDLFQEVWLDVFRGIAKLTRPEVFPAWLYQIARHRVCRALRRRRQPLSSLEEIDEPGTAEGETEFGAEDAEKVHAALGRLKPDQREVLLLRFLEGFSYEDIARVLGCRLGTVRSRIHYAKLALRRVMERMGGHE